MSRRSTLLLVLALVAVALSGCSARGEAATVDAPAWQPGYTWSLDGTVAVAYEEAFGDERDNGTERAELRRTERVVQTRLQDGDEPLYLAVRHTESTDELDLYNLAPALVAYRQSDLKPLEVRGLRSDSCNGAGPCSSALHDVTVRDAHPDDPFLPFPVETGDAWSGRYDVFGGMLGVRYDAEAGRMEVVETAVGPVEALRVEFHHRAANATEAERSLEAQARDQGVPVRDVRIEFRVDQVLYYSPTYQTVVRSAATSHSLLSATVPDPEGGTSQARSEYRTEERWSLSGARLVAGPENTLDEVAALLDPEADLGDVAGVPVPVSAYDVAIDAVTAEVNAFSGEAGRFQARIDGAEGLPEGHALRWSLLDVRGAEVAAGDGEAFEPVAPTAGRYAVVLEAVAEDGVVATAGGVLVAHYQGRLELDCDPHATNVVVTVDACDVVEVPVHPGVTSVTLVATPSGSGDPFAELEVRDAIGRRVEAESSGDGQRVDLDSFEGVNVGQDAWTVVWNAGSGLLGGATLDVDVQYGGAPATSPPEAQEGAWWPVDGWPVRHGASWP